MHYDNFLFQKFIQSSDQNQSGDITLAEFIHYVKEHEKKLQLVFASLDTDKDGRIKVNELVTAFRDLGVSITAKEAQQLLKRFFYIIYNLPLYLHQFLQSLLL